MAAWPGSAAQAVIHAAGPAPIALAGYWRYERPGQPRASLDDTKATVVDLDDKTYVVLSIGKRQLAVFRVRNDGIRCCADLLARRALCEATRTDRRVLGTQPSSPGRRALTRSRADGSTRGSG